MSMIDFYAVCRSALYFLPMWNWSAKWKDLEAAELFTVYKSAISVGSLRSMLDWKMVAFFFFFETRNGGFKGTSVERKINKLTK